MAVAFVKLSVCTFDESRLRRLGRVLRHGGEVGRRRLVEQRVTHMADLESTVLHRTAHDDLAVAGLAIDLTTVSTVRLLRRAGEELDGRPSLQPFEIACCAIVMNEFHFRKQQTAEMPTFSFLDRNCLLQLPQWVTSSSCCHLTSKSACRIFSNSI